MSSAYEQALSLIDAAHSEDPTKIAVDGEDVPYELHYARRCTHYLAQHTPAASPALRLAVRAQHFRRWEVPRASYPMTRAGYHAWRGFLKRRQAEQVQALCAACGVAAAEAERVASLIRKEGLKSDEEAQALEDVACLVFLDDQFEAFERGLEEQKIVGILKKTWGKMGQRGRELALQMRMSERCMELVKMALAES